MGNYAGLIEMAFFYGIAISFGLWQWLKMRRELRESRERRAAEDAANKEGKDA